jgi:hypothetical protein
MTAVTSTRVAATRPHNGVWVLAGLQCAYAVWFVVCAWLALARARHFAGHYYIPALNDRYTADADVPGGWPWAGAVTNTAMVGPLFSMLLAAASAGWLVLGSLLGHFRGRRAAFFTLLSGTVVVLATVVVVLSPAGRSVTGWLLD